MASARNILQNMRQQKLIDHISQGMDSGKTLGAL